MIEHTGAEGNAMFDNILFKTYTPKTECTVTWNVEGTLTEEVYEEGDMLAFKSEAVKEGDVQYSYVLSGWDKELAAVTGDVTYTAQYKATEKIKFYTVAWIVDGVETVETYEVGVMPTFKGSTIKASDKTNYYTFSGWDKEIVKVNADVTYTAQHTPHTLIKFVAATVSMGNNLDMKFALKPAEVTAAGGQSVVIKHVYGDGREDRETVIPVAELGMQGVYYAVVYDGLAAKQMCDVVTLTVINADGQPVSEPWTDSMRDYEMRMYSSAKTDLVKTLYVDMLNYGAAAQEFSKYKTGDLANNQLTDEQKAMARADSVTNLQRMIMRYSDTACEYLETTR